MHGRKTGMGESGMTSAQVRRREELQKSNFAIQQPWKCHMCSFETGPVFRDQILEHYDSDHPEAPVHHQIFYQGWKVASSRPGESIIALKCLCGFDASPLHGREGRFIRAAEHLALAEHGGEVIVRYD